MQQFLEHKQLAGARITVKTGRNQRVEAAKEAAGLGKVQQSSGDQENKESREDGACYGQEVV